MSQFDGEPVEILLSYKIAQHLKDMVNTCAEKCMSCELLKLQLQREIIKTAKNAHNRVLRLGIKKNKYHYFDKPDQTGKS